MLVEARSDELVDLRRDDRERDEAGAEQRELELGDEIFQQRGVDEFRVLGTRDPHERPDQHVVDLLGEEEAEDEGNAEAKERLDQPRTQLDQMVHQGSFAGLDIGGAHDALASLIASAGAVSWMTESCVTEPCVTCACSTSRVMASGSFTAACASASTKVSGVGASGVVGVAGASLEVASASLEVAGGSTAAEVSAGLSSASTRSASLTSFWSEVIRLLPAKPEAASLTSSKLFLRSAISASRIASWNWPWNSAAILRPFPIHCPTMRSTPGSSFGPMAIRATTPIRTSSLHPMSNMRSSVHASSKPAQSLARRIGSATRVSRAL